MKRVLIAIVCLACLYSAYMYGRETMYADMLAALGGAPNSKIMVLTPSAETIYHPAGICATCHGG